MEAKILKEQIAWACRILWNEDHGDFTLGHASARADRDTVYIKRSGLGLNEVTPQDVLTVDLEGRKIAGEGELHVETCLHTQVYKVRPDVGAVIHTHPPFAIAFGATETRLEYLSHDSVLFRDGLAFFDETAELIRSPAMGAKVAAALGSRRVLILRNHGLLVVGKDLPWATVTAIALARAIHIQTMATQLGSLWPMSSEMVQRIYPTKYSDELVYAYWDYLIREGRRKDLGEGMPANQA